MSRPLKIQYPGAWRHVINRGRRAEAFFAEKNDYIAEEISVILGKKKLPAMLGSKGFIEQMRRLFSAEKRHAEVPESRSLTPHVRGIQAVWGARDIM